MSISREIDEKINIVDLVSRYLSLKKAGVNYKASCPFHSEKTPSFVVSPAKNIAYCFSCHNGGGPVKFLSEIEKIPFSEAVHKLAKEAGIELKTDFYKERRDSSGDIFDIYKVVTEFYHADLYKSENSDKLEYLYKRGLSDETIKKFKLGYSGDPRGLFYKLTESGFKEKDILESGIFLSSSKDKFYSRIVFPIANYGGNVVAFTGRVLDNSLPKYLNSPATKIFDKSSILFGLNLAKTEIGKKDFVIIVEGQMDTVSLHQAGFDNTVAISGTALTDEQIKILKRLTKNIFFCFDNDNAGINATFSSIENTINQEVNIKIIDLGKNKDPDEIVKSGQDFNDYVKNSMSLVQFYIKQGEKKYDITGVQGKVSLIKDLMKKIKKISHDLERDFHINEISKLLDIGVDTLYKELNQTRDVNFSRVSKIEKKGFGIFEQICGYMTLYGYFDLFFENFHYNVDEIEGGDFSNTLVRLLQAKNTYLEDESIDIDFIKSIELFIEEENIEGNKDKIKKNFKDLVNILNKSIYEKKKALLDLRMKEDPSNNELFQEYSKLIVEAKKYSII
ncbi:MAG: DNA primase [Candidatus Gracilibacteria bacterium]|nr:DNA primase [Candidatus Gracilibacteria bacterium]